MCTLLMLSLFVLIFLILGRIQKNMLMDLSKDIMMDLGITVIGDIIAILKHAKQVYRQVSQAWSINVM